VQQFKVPVQVKSRKGGEERGKAEGRRMRDEENALPETSIEK
jgi:hypothetical protein